jgi:hypothetical protein
MHYSSGLDENYLKNMSNEDNDYNAHVTASACPNVTMPPCMKQFSRNSVKCTERMKCLPKYYHLFYQYNRTTRVKIRFSKNQ